MKQIKEFFMLNLKDYTDGALPFPIGAVLTAGLLALCAVMFVITYRKRYTVAIVRGLIRQKAFGEDSARTLKALRLADNRSVKRALSRSGQLTYLVKRAGAESLDYEEYVKKSKQKGFREEKIDFSTAAFYIPDPQVDRARGLVEKTNTSWLIPIICSVLFALLLVLAFFFLPDLLELLIKAE